MWNVRRRHLDAIVGFILVVLLHMSSSATISMYPTKHNWTQPDSAKTCDGQCDLISAQALEEVLAKHSDYKVRRPFPFLFQDGLFPADILADMESEIPDHPLHIDGCVADSSVCGTDAHQFRKNGFNQDQRLGPATRRMFSFLRSSVFVRFLEQLTGIDNLLPDPSYVGAGVHQTLAGGFLHVHADFNRYPRNNWHRRVNVFVFLNPNWDDAYGGHLELWDRSVERCEAMIRPSLGRLVVFSSTDFSFHGHPSPLTVPSRRSRRSLALYYYSLDRPQSECVEDDCASLHSTLWQTPRCNSCLDPRCREFDHIL